MSNKEFENIYSANFKDKKKEIALHLYIRYLYFTEEFDRIVCPHTNGIPSTGSERTRCTMNALKEKKKMIQLYRYLDIDFVVYKNFLHMEADKMSHETVTEYYYYLLQNGYYEQFKEYERNGE